jgi:hypothetical protein
MNSLSVLNLASVASRFFAYAPVLFYSKSTSPSGKRDRGSTSSVLFSSFLPVTLDQKPLILLPISASSAAFKVLEVLASTSEKKALNPYLALSLPSEKSLIGFASL